MTKAQLEKPSSENELKLLKDFQRRSLDAVFRRLYLDEPPTRRFLLADEVGLGKTLVARGLITKVIEHLWDTVKRIDIVYLCSNSDIARQNVSRLTPRGIQGVALASRITLLPIAAEALRGRRVNIIALTPGTSLNLKGNLGLKLERALLLHMLQPHWNLNLTGSCRVFAARASLDRFKAQVRSFSADHNVDDVLRARFLKAVDDRGEEQRAAGGTSLRVRLEALIAAYRESRSQSAVTERECFAIIGELRQVLAKSCIDALEPDLIILDEFQRFKNLLDGTNAAGELAQQLFDYGNEIAKTRVLLLSATPYKMYTNIDEGSGEDHYADFLRTTRFLLNEEPAEADNLARLLSSYRRELFRLGQGGGGDLEDARSGIERILRKVIVRTERLAVTPDRNGMLVEKLSSGISVAAGDATSYVGMQRLARLIKHADTIEYWKSAPWLLNFMDQYELSIGVNEIIDAGHPPREFVRALESAQGSMLPWSDVESFRQLEPPHGRLRWLTKHTLDDGLWKVLWLPPSLGYYELGEPFRAVAACSATKALLFSAWRVVPKVVAAALSHEAERRMYVSLEGANTDLRDAPERLGDLLKVGRKDGRMTGLTVLSILYPSSWLAKACDPMSLAAKAHRASGMLPTVDELLSAIEDGIRPRLAKVTSVEATRTTPDESWYWAAPILLDRLDNAESTMRWFDGDPVSHWSNKGDAVKSRVDESDDDEALSDDERDGDESSGLRELANRAASTARGEFVPSGLPPKDLLRTLALMALGGPATVALRAFSRITNGDDEENDAARNGAGTVGGGFRTLFNQPDSTAIIRSSARDAGRTGDYWKHCLEYCASGGLQAVLDEYTHLLIEEAGVFGKSANEVVKSISDNMVAAVGIRRAKVGVQNIVTANGMVERHGEAFRSRFAMRYGDERADETGDKVRADDVRRAFNSPFWPFVLATTSVGQEGLDFHLYCHKVIHWNLPPNPVDLEQREGRVHRFKGHAVRKNVATKHADVWRGGANGNPWDATFAAAKAGRLESDNDLVPYWVYPIDGGASIERHVPMYPLSREIGRLTQLRHALALYRMVFGQPRQEELLSYLSQVVPEGEIAALSERMKISLAP